MSILHLPASTNGEEVSAALAEFGAVIVDNLVTAAYMDGVADELRPWIDATEFGPDDFTGRVPSALAVWSVARRSAVNWS
jgi:hypothetical protein